MPLHPVSVPFNRRHCLLAAAFAAAPLRTLAQAAAPTAMPSARPLDDADLAADPPRLDPVPPVPAAPAPGQPGDFGFLDGRWQIRHLKRRKDGWDRFSGEARCWSILGGVGSVEELLIPARDFSGLGLRLLDVERRIWSDHWVNAKSGVVGVPGLLGGFQGTGDSRVGLFPSTDEDNGRSTLSMGIWDRIAPGQCRWRQVVSSDGGRSWEHDWVMHWRRSSSV